LPEDRVATICFLLNCDLRLRWLDILAFALDLGFVYVSQTQLQRSADAAALAAGWEMLDEDALSGNGETNVLASEIRTVAEQYAAENYVLTENPELALDDVTLGTIANPFSSNWQMQQASAGPYNAVTVRVRRHEDTNGRVPFFFARILGHDSVAIEAEATAVLLWNIRGFQTPSDGSNLEILPYALDEDT